ncbi:multidrug resistance protein YkkD [Shouchella clausii]|uniref:DMT family transporter n=1 Tax=Shouchella clausii TaxID=79880 RepID=UPI001AFD1CDC|nr:multidrug efflux SMR transporter [Shouchella clausii]GIN18572.1 multidrug resistance protein YkkD [Shouchella clausii]
MAWVYVIVAGLLEMFGLAMMNRFKLEKKLLPLVLLVISFSASFILLSLAMETLPMGTVYAVWTGIGAFGGAAIGMFVYGEPKTASRIFFIFLILGSVIALKAVS